MNHLLMYNIPPEKAGKIKAIGLRHGFRIRVVRPEEFGHSVGALAGLPETQVQGDGAAFTDEMLVLCGVEGKAFHSFLAQLREKKVPVTLKAVLTEHNAQWTSSKLHESLVQEYEMLKSAGKSVHNQ